MKLRMRKHSVRLRVSQSEMAALTATGRIEETVYFTADGDGFTYVLESVEDLPFTEVRHDAVSLSVRLPSRVMLHWAQPDQVGVYETLRLGERGDLHVIVEKDFACLDLSDAENVDTFPNPNAGAAC